MKITGRTAMLSDYSVDKSFEMMKEFGFEGIEMSFTDRQFGYTPNAAEKFYIDHVNDLVKKFDLPICSVSCHGDFMYDDTRFEEVKKTVALAHSYGTDICIISNAFRPLYMKQSDWDLLVTRTKEIVALGEKHGVTIAMEFEPAFVCSTTKELLKLMEEVNSDYFKANLDLGHVFLRDPDPMEAIKSLEGKIAHCHIENMSRGVHRHLPPYMGDMDLGEYINKLGEIGFDGAMALDLYQDDYIEIAEKSVSYIKELIAKVVNE